MSCGGFGILRHRLVYLSLNSTPRDIRDKSEVPQRNFLVISSQNHKPMSCVPPSS